jgi:hypothetical protein
MWALPTCFSDVGLSRSSQLRNGYASWVAAERAAMICRPWSITDIGACRGFSVACLPAACHHATVTDDPLLDRAQRLWVDLAGAPVVFRDLAIDVAVSPRSLLCPAGWVGIVGLGSAVIAAAPDDDTAEIVQRAPGALPATAITDPAVVSRRLPATEL